MYSLKKKFRFEAAHRFSCGYIGKCSHLHGHSWAITVEFGSKDLNQAGMARDFTSFKDFKHWINDNLDHSTLVAYGDESLLSFLVLNNQRHYKLTPNPTSEVLVHELFQVLKNKFKITDILSVEVEETCTCSAKYSGGQV